MKVIEGDFAGSRGRIINAVFQGPILEINTGMLGSEKFKLPEDVETFKLLNKDEQRTIGQLLILIILAVTVIGLVLAIPLFVIWKRVTFTAGVRTRSGKKFIIQGDENDWKAAKGFIGIGNLNSF